MSSDWGGDWSSQFRIKDGGPASFGSSEGPSLAVLGERVYVAWKGASSDGRIWYSFMDEHLGEWAAQKSIPDVSTEDGPRLAAFDNKLHVAWRGKSNKLYYASMERKFYVPSQQVIPGVGTGRGLSLATAGYGRHEALIAAWRGASEEDLYFSIMEKKAVWREEKRVSTGLSSVGPAIACYGYGDGEVLYAAWKGEGSDIKLYYASISRKDEYWSDPAELPEALSNFRPALTQYKDRLYAAWRSSDGAEAIWWSSLDKDKKWSRPCRVEGVGSKYEPSLAVFDNQLCAAWRGKGSDAAIYYQVITSS